MNNEQLGGSPYVTKAIAYARDGLVNRKIPAATYSPTHLRMQYHRRWQA
jgi:hypothetical protein